MNSNDFVTLNSLRYSSDDLIDISQQQNNKTKAITAKNISNDHLVDINTNNQLYSNYVKVLSVSSLGDMNNFFSDSSQITDNEDTIQSNNNNNLTVDLELDRELDLDLDFDINLDDFSLTFDNKSNSGPPFYDAHAKQPIKNNRPSDLLTAYSSYNTSPKFLQDKDSDFKVVVNNNLPTEFVKRSFGRQKQIIEIIKTEKVYLCSLEILKKVYIDNFISDIKTPIYFQKFDDCIKKLIENHTKLLDDLNAIYDHYSIFFKKNDGAKNNDKTNKFLPDSPLFNSYNPIKDEMNFIRQIVELISIKSIDVDVYSTYCSLFNSILEFSNKNGIENYKRNSIVILNDYIVEHRNLQQSDFFIDQRIDTRFISVVQMPTNRISRYKLMIQSLIKNIDLDEKNIETVNYYNNLIFKLGKKIDSINKSVGLKSNKNDQMNHFKGLINKESIDKLHDKLFLENLNYVELVSSFGVVYVNKNNKYVSSDYLVGVLFDTHLILLKPLSSNNTSNNNYNQNYSHSHSHSNSHVHSHSRNHNNNNNNNNNNSNSRNNNSNNRNNNNNSINNSGNTVDNNAMNNNTNYLQNNNKLEIKLIIPLNSILNKFNESDVDYRLATTYPYTINLIFEDFFRQNEIVLVFPDLMEQQIWFNNLKVKVENAKKGNNDSCSGDFSFSKLKERISKFDIENDYEKFKFQSLNQLNISSFRKGGKKKFFMDNNIRVFQVNHFDPSDERKTITNNNNNNINSVKYDLNVPTIKISRQERVYAQNCVGSKLWSNQFKIYHLSLSMTRSLSNLFSLTKISLSSPATPSSSASNSPILLKSSSKSSTKSYRNARDQFFQPPASIPSLRSSGSLLSIHSDVKSIRSTRSIQTNATDSSASGRLGGFSRLLKSISVSSGLNGVFNNKKAS